MSIFSEKVVEKINIYLNRYETRRSAILPILHTIQDTYGWIKNEHIETLEKDFKLSKIHIQEVATFYSNYRLKEPKPFRIYFCDNLVCTIKGAKSTMQDIKDHLSKYEKSGKDCPFSLEGVPCLGVCDKAPAMLVNKDRYSNVNKDNFETILDKYNKLL